MNGKKSSHMIAKECDKETTQELDLLSNLDLDDGDFVEFLVEWTDGAADIPNQIQQETAKTRNGGKRKNVAVVTETSTSDQRKKRSKKLSKQPHSSGGSDGITETAECSAHMAAAGSY